MSRELVISALAALGCHGLLLFGLRLETPAVPRPLADTGIEVSLVAGEPSAPAPPESPQPPDPPVAEVTPPPEPVPELVPESVPQPPAQEEMVEPAPKPRPSEAQPHPVPHPSKPGPPAVTHHASSSAGPGTPSVSPSSGALNTKPGYRSNPRPDYPIEARQQRQQGRVVLEVVVNAEGHPTSVSLSRGSGFPLLDAAALNAVRRWTFEPARVAGVPVAARVAVPVQFDLAQ